MGCACACNGRPWPCGSPGHRHFGQSKSQLLVGLEQSVGGGLDDNDPIEAPRDRRGILETKPGQRDQHHQSDVDAQNQQDLRDGFKAAGGPWNKGRALLASTRT